MSKRYPSGQTDISVDVTFVDDTGLPVTGLVAATMPTIKRSSGTGADATITLSDLTALTDAHSEGGVKERGEGVYRLDLPDLADGTHKIRGEATDKRLICEDIQVGVATTLPSIPANWITAAGIAADAITAAKVAADLIAAIQSGLATSSELAKVPKSDGTVAFNATAVSGIQSGLATASALATAQADLDIITGTDGVTLATSQPNYAPATAAALDAVDNFIDTEIADIQSRLPAALVGGRMDSSVGAMATGVLTATAIAADAITAAKVASDTLDEIAAAVRDISNASPAAGSLGENIKNALADTNELQADWADGGRLDLILDARASQTSVDTIDNFLDTEIAAILEDTGTTLPAQIAAITTTQLTEGYAADGVAPTLEEATFMILQSLHEFAITGTSRTAKKLDGTTTAMVFTLDSDTAPTSTTRSA